MGGSDLDLITRGLDNQVAVYYFPRDGMGDA